MQWIILPGLTDYAEFLPVMEQKLNHIISGQAKETIYLLEHKEIYTAGSSYQKEELLDLDHIPFMETGRGGKTTYHGPGQVVIYPLLDLRKKQRQRDLKLYVKKLEQVLIQTLQHYGLKPYLLDNYIGIWVEHQNKPAKIAAIGIRIRKWVTYHGAAINLTTDLTKFNNIIPCGIRHFPVISLQELGIEVDKAQFNQLLQKEFEKIFVLKNFC